MKRKNTNSLAILSFVLGLMGVIMCIIHVDVALLLGISTIILASIAILKAGIFEKKIHGYAIAAIFLAVIVIVGYFFYEYYLPHLIDTIARNLSKPLP